MVKSSPRAGGLRVVEGGVEPKGKPRRPKRTRPVDDKARAHVEQEMAKGEAVVDALDLIAAAVTAPGAQLALDRAHAAAEQLGDDVEHLRLVLAVLTTQAVWGMPPAGERPRTDRQILERQISLQLWGGQRRREVVAELRRGRRLLRRDP